MLFNRRRKEFHLAMLVSRKTGWSIRKSIQKMDYAKKKYNIPYIRYYESEAYDRPETWLRRKGNSLQRKREQNSLYIEELSSETGIPVEQINAEINKCRKMYKGRMGAPTYVLYELYKMDEKQKKTFFAVLEKKDELMIHFRTRLAAYYEGKCTIEELNNLAEEFRRFLPNLISNTIIARRTERLYEVIPDLIPGSERCQSIIVDMELSRYLFLLTGKEYLMFRLWEKTIEEKMEYIPDGRHTPMILKINGADLSELCNDKKKSYDKLGKYYGRELIFIKSDDDIDRFVEFGMKHKKAVIKPSSASKGQGVRLIDFSLETNLENRVTASHYLRELLDENGNFVLEELIVQNEVLKKLNPDSVNTVRVIAYNDGSKVVIDGSLMRVGRTGAFVDNGGAGGILIGINWDEGEMYGSGHDKDGNIYEHHPDTGVLFDGYKLPEWNKAKNTIETAAKALGKGYIGWDITCTASDEWIVVEANGTPQFFGKQSTTGKGALPDFINTVGKENYSVII